jgi:threonine/homoserine/homoserine lactone efflux protein
MLGIHHLPLFIASGLLLNMTPGQDTLYIVGRSVSQGRRAGVLSVLGISAGCLVHTLAAAFGLSAVLATSASAFFVVKMVGAAYLIYLGGRMLLERSPAPPADPTVAPVRGGPTSSWAIFRAGMLTNILNPKVALFFLAFLPQFVDPAATAKVAAFLLLGLIFIFNGTLWCLLVVWFASNVSRRLRGNGRIGAWLKRATGALFVGLGIKLAVSE